MLPNRQPLDGWMGDEAMCLRLLLRLVAVRPGWPVSSLAAVPPLDSRTTIVSSVLSFRDPLCHESWWDAVQQSRCRPACSEYFCVLSAHRNVCNVLLLPTFRPFHNSVSNRLTYIQFTSPFTSSLSLFEPHASTHRQVSDSVHLQPTAEEVVRHQQHHIDLQHHEVKQQEEVPLLKTKETQIPFHQSCFPPLAYPQHSKKIATTGHKGPRCADHRHFLHWPLAAFPTTRETRQPDYPTIEISISVYKIPLPPFQPLTHLQGRGAVRSVQGRTGHCSPTT